MPLPKTLVIIETDPRTSARPAEAIRIAAGIGVWKKTDVCQCATKNTRMITAGS